MQEVAVIRTLKDAFAEACALWGGKIEEQGGGVRCLLRGFIDSYIVADVLREFARLGAGVQEAGADRFEVLAEAEYEDRGETGRRSSHYRHEVVLRPRREEEGFSFDVDVRWEYIGEDEARKEAEAGGGETGARASAEVRARKNLWGLRRLHTVPLQDLADEVAEAFLDIHCSVLEPSDEADERILSWLRKAAEKAYSLPSLFELLEREE